jgi:hypothetical protein
VDLAFDDGRVGDDLALDSQHEMDAANGVVPVVLGEFLVLVRPKRRDEQPPNRLDLGRRQIGRREPPQPGPVDDRYLPRASVSAMRASTSLVTRPSGSGASGAKWIVPFVVSYEASSSRCAAMTARL